MLPGRNIRMPQPIPPIGPLLVVSAETGSGLAPDAPPPYRRRFSHMAAVFNLNHPAHTVHWHFFTMSVSNIIVIAVMLIVFVAAILIPFPRHKQTRDAS